MDLFERIEEGPRNLLPKDGVVHYHGPVMPLADADQHFKKLLENIQWQHDEAVIFGKKIVTRRKVAWYGEEPFSYSYSGSTKSALPWTGELQTLKKIAEEVSEETFNSCLLNLYHDGSEGMTWHSDAEKELKRNGAIASLSFGAERKFSFKHRKSKETVAQILEHGSLLVMKGETQSHWLHSLPTTKRVSKPRINLTFRTIDAR